RLDLAKLTESADVYSFGMTIYEIISGGKFPFELDGLVSEHQVVGALYNQKRPCRPSVLCSSTGDLLCTEKIWALTENCWNHDPALRPTFPQIVAMLEQPDFLSEISE
ncbi:hypothetical protein HK096_000431, partial [Nowakowskiella sp. JEL0078]